MSDKRLSIGRMELNAGAREAGLAQAGGSNFSILVLSDFTGRENCDRNDAGSIVERPITTVDRDNFEEVLERFGARLDRTLLTDEGEHVSVHFKSLDDFHPDELFEKLSVFESLRKLRRQLMNPNLCANAIEEINSWQTGDITLPGDDVEDEPSDNAAKPDVSREETPMVTVDQLFGEDFGQSNQGSDVSIQWKQVVSDLVERYRSPSIDPNRDEYVALIDGAIQRAMRSLLHHPHFRGLESAWRGVSLLTSGLDTSSKLRVQICDVSKTEVIQDLGRQDSLNESQLYKRLVEQTVGTPGGKPWTIVVGAFDFDTGDRDVSTLARLGQLAHAAGSKLFVDVAGTPDFWCDGEQVATTGWNELKQNAAAKSIGVFWPRTLLRLPFGKKTSLTERFVFEEREPGDSVDLLSWGYSSMLAALQIGKQQSTRGSFDTTDVMTQSDMPLLVETIHGEAEVQPCGQYLLTDEQIHNCIEVGITPIVSMKGRAEVVIQGMQSLGRAKL